MTRHSAQIYMYAVCVYVHTYTHIHICIYTYLYTNVYTCIYTFVCRYRIYKGCGKRALGRTPEFISCQGIVVLAWWVVAKW